MFEVSARVSGKFRNMSVLCALLVVVIHCRPRFEQGTLAWYAKEILENGVCEMAVPFFFLMSGFFVSAKIFAGDWRGEVAKRMRTLLLPYAFWVTAYWLFVMLLARRTFLPSVAQLGLNPFVCPILTPLWYVRALFSLILLSQLIAWGLKRLPRVALLSLGLLYGPACPYCPMPEWGLFRDFVRIGPVPVLGLFYFSLGMAIRLRLIDFAKLKLQPALCMAAGIALVVIRAAAVDLGHGMFAAYCGFASIPFLLCGAWRLMPEVPWPKALTTASFPIYLIHKFFYPLVGPAMSKAACACLGRSYVMNPVLDYVLCFSSVFVLSLMATHVIRRLAPGFASVVFGGR